MSDINCKVDGSLNPSSDLQDRIICIPTLSRCCRCCGSGDSRQRTALSTGREDFLEILVPNSNTITLRFKLELQRPKNWQRPSPTLRVHAGVEGALRSGKPRPLTPGPWPRPPIATSLGRFHARVPPIAPTSLPSRYVLPAPLRGRASSRFFPSPSPGRVPAAPPAGAQTLVTRRRGAAAGPSPPGSGRLAGKNAEPSAVPPGQQGGSVPVSLLSVLCSGRGTLPAPPRDGRLARPLLTVLRLIVLLRNLDWITRWKNQAGPGDLGGQEVLFKGRRLTGEWSPKVSAPSTKRAIYALLLPHIWHFWHMREAGQGEGPGLVR
ncbi:atherin-like [Eumetopias jubatus]|uniref:atherin-like n=1 Tax=Eumetopias jubatus TaxID=34886 RepID=UPI00101651B7|nr:atherin-like [Eumetopias jubatus]